MKQKAFLVIFKGLSMKQIIQFLGTSDFNSILQLINDISSISKNYLHIIIVQELLHFLEFHSVHLQQGFLVM